MAAIVFRLADGAVDALEALRSAGLALACVANWDMSLQGAARAARRRPSFEVVVSSAEAGAEKPDPAIFERALGELGVAATRALHVGDEEVDRDRRARGRARVRAAAARYAAGAPRPMSSSTTAEQDV